MYKYSVVIFKQHLVSLSVVWCMNLFYSLVGVFIAFSREQCNVMSLTCVSSVPKTHICGLTAVLVDKDFLFFRKA